MSYRSYIPALFVAARGDEFVQPHHSQTIHDKYAGDKNLIYVEGDHNSNRPLFMFTSVGIFLTNTLQLPEAWSLSSDAEKYVSLGLKPWDYVGEGVGNRSNISGLRAMLMGLDDYGQQIDAHNDDAALERVLALSLLEQQGSSKHNTSNQVKGRVGTNNNVLKKAPDTSADITGNINGGVEIGMTADRQEDIQKAIYNMFNGTASGTGAGLQTTATPEPPKAIPPKNDTTSNLKSCNIALEVPARENVEKAVPAEGKANGAIQKSTSSSRRLPDNIAGFELINDTDAQVGAGAEEVTGISNENIDGISCCHCTLINAPTLKFCLACNNPLSLMPLKES